MNKQIVPVITLDGPSGTGKGTISSLLAERLRWHWLDSGSIYRAMAWVLMDRGWGDLDDVESVLSILKETDIQVGSELINGQSIPWVRVAGVSLGDAIRTEACSQGASRVAAIPAIRDLVLSYQRSFADWPGLVTDGRDMGSVVFPNAVLKVFLTASAAVRAKRRQKQLQERGIAVSLSSVLEEIEARDARDSSRDVAPLKAASDAIEVDTSDLSIADVMATIWTLVSERVL